MYPFKLQIFEFKNKRKHFKMISGQSQQNTGALYRKRQPLGEITNTYRVKNGC
jgi:hypothetical protein